MIIVLRLGNQPIKQNTGFGVLSKNIVFRVHSNVLLLKARHCSQKHFEHEDRTNTQNELFKLLEI